MFYKIMNVYFNIIPDIRLIVLNLVIVKDGESV